MSVFRAVSPYRSLLAAAAMVAAVAVCQPLAAQIIDDGRLGRSVGGIMVNADGVLDSATLDASGELSRARAQSLQPLAGDLKAPAEQRKISLRRLEEAIQAATAEGKPLPDEIKYLAGLQQIDYVFAYPEQQDIVLVGRGEGWRVDAKGYVVGLTTGRPVMLLDDLLLALRTARTAAQNPISCSIDPTPDGLTRLRSLVGRLKTIGNPPQTIAGIEQALGMQQISFTGVPATSHFARVLIAADYRMKRLAMGLDPSPVRSLPSFLQMVTASGRGMSNMLPRWWLEPDYEPLLRSADGLAWQLRGGRVKCMTEEDFLTASGNREHTGKASPMAQRWAEGMSRHYDELAVAEPVFGQLRNCMELAIVGALVMRENLPQKASCSMPVLLDDQAVATDQFAAPKQVPSKASVLKKGRNWIISASGGVQLNSWAVAARVEAGDAPQAIRSQAVPAEGKKWWWN